MTAQQLKFSDNHKRVNKILEALAENNGYCPCKLEVNENTKCPCLEFRITGVCHCGLYETIEVDKNE